MMRKQYGIPSQKTGSFGENPKKLAVSGIEPRTSRTRTGRCFTCSVWSVTNVMRKIVYKRKSNDKILPTGGDNMTKDTGIYVT